MFVEKVLMIYLNPMQILALMGRWCYGGRRFIVQVLWSFVSMEHGVKSVEELSTITLQGLLAHSLDTHDMVCYCYIVDLKTILAADAEV